MTLIDHPRYLEKPFQTVKSLCPHCCKEIILPYSTSELVAFETGYNCGTKAMTEFKTELAKVTAERDAAFADAAKAAHDSDLVTPLKEFTRNEYVRGLIKERDEVIASAIEGWRKSVCAFSTWDDCFAPDCKCKGYTDTGEYCQSVLDHCKVEGVTNANNNN